MKGIFDIGLDYFENGSTVEHKEWSMEAMQEEIQALASTENLMEQETASKAYLSTCESELAIKRMACRESAGKDKEAAIAIFNNYGLVDEFSMEAAKDVLARGAYMGAAKVKAMIAAIIKYLQELITFSTTSNKGFKALEKLAKKTKEALKKKQGSPKVSSDKFVRELSILEAADINNLKLVTFLTDELAEGSANKESAKDVAESVIQIFLGSDVDTTKPLAEKLNEKKTNINDEIADLKEKLNEKEEYEKTSLLTKAISNLEIVESTAKALGKDKGLKSLEKIKSKLSKYTNESYIKKEFKASGKNKENIDAGEFQTIIQNLMQAISILIHEYKTTSKLALTTLDRVVTEGKAVEAMLA